MTLRLPLAFFDTNVIIYALTASDARKHAVASALVRDHALAHRLVISTQVLLESYEVLTRKFKLPAAAALEALGHLAEREVVGASAEGVMRGLALAARHGWSTWDAQIAQAALSADCTVLYTEDMQAGFRLGGLEWVNPFLTQAHEALPACFGDRPAKMRSRSPARRAADR
jgi:predicted nucleic acid-binding protein